MDLNAVLISLVALNILGRFFAISKRSLLQNEDFRFDEEHNEIVCIVKIIMHAYVN